MSQSTCWFCANKNDSIRKFKIRENDNDGHAAYDYLTSLFGQEVERYLQKNIILCDYCVHLLKNIAQVNKHLFLFVQLIDELPEEREEKFKNICHKLKITWQELEDSKIGDNMSETSDNLREMNQTPTVLVPTYSLPHRVDYNGRLPATSSGGRQLGGRVEDRRGSNETSVRPTNDAQAVSMPCWTVSGYKEKHQGDLNNKRENAVGTSSTNYTELRTKPRTRSVTNKFRDQSMKFYCVHSECPQLFKSVDELTCIQCDEESLEKSLFGTLGSNTVTAKLYCSSCKYNICGDCPINAHLQEHEKYSNECKFCDILFSNSEELRDHISQGHKKDEPQQTDGFLEMIINEEKMKN
ncbi:hypothetical protein HHI36_023562 [Cryptolaemus montrouzieri]|uniref:C2H2-type domain-containing protein n=1 Tax=Cryptolaemus montrouzieri TaxID=559131 RepID=A0ABD2PGS3_9CUCU